MSKYSFELKIQVVQEYLDGKGGYDYLAKKFKIKCTSDVKKWVNIYKEFGTEGLVRKHKNNVYTVQFKLNAIELYQTSELSYREVANTLRINNPSLIINWMRRFREDGIEGLSRQKGRPPAMTKKMNDKSLKNQIPIENSSNYKDRIKELEIQVRTLQIENAFLKELRKLRKQEACEQIKQSQKLSLASEDNSN